jgi:hypothetical protein
MDLHNKQGEHSQGNRILAAQAINETAMMMMKNDPNTPKK